MHSSWAQTMGRCQPVIKSEQEPLKKSPVIADENTKGFWKCVEMGNGIFIAEMFR